ncbi:unnamed protein product [Amoebophrya sp. A120]|nr:unnamed protein product [Amoebophrya sp. A120]|eukprot:GSA120T00009292001.1
MSAKMQNTSTDHREDKNNSLAQNDEQQNSSSTLRQRRGAGGANGRQNNPKGPNLQNNSDYTPQRNNEKNKKGLKQVVLSPATPPVSSDQKLSPAASSNRNKQPKTTPVKNPKLSSPPRTKSISERWRKAEFCTKNTFFPTTEESKLNAPPAFRRAVEGGGDHLWQAGQHQEGKSAAFVPSRADSSHTHNQSRSQSSKVSFEYPFLEQLHRRGQKLGQDPQNTLYESTTFVGAIREGVMGTDFFYSFVEFVFRLLLPVVAVLVLLVGGGICVLFPSNSTSTEEGGGGGNPNTSTAMDFLDFSNSLFHHSSATVHAIRFFQQFFWWFAILFAVAFFSEKHLSGWRPDYSVWPEENKRIKSLAHLIQPGLYYCGMTSSPSGAVSSGSRGEDLMGNEFADGRTRTEATSTSPPSAKASSSPVSKSNSKSSTSSAKNHNIMVESGLCGGITSVMSSAQLLEKIFTFGTTPGGRARQSGTSPTADGIASSSSPANTGAAGDLLSKRETPTDGGSSSSSSSGAKNVVDNGKSRMMNAKNSEVELELAEMEPSSPAVVSVVAPQADGDKEDQPSAGENTAMVSTDPISHTPSTASTRTTASASSSTATSNDGNKLSTTTASSTNSTSNNSRCRTTPADTSTATTTTVVSENSASGSGVYSSSKTAPSSLCSRKLGTAATTRMSATSSNNLSSFVRYWREHCNFPNYEKNYEAFWVKYLYKFLPGVQTGDICTLVPYTCYKAPKGKKYDCRVWIRVPAGRPGVERGKDQQSTTASSPPSCEDSSTTLEEAIAVDFTFPSTEVDVAGVFDSATTKNEPSKKRKPLPLVILLHGLNGGSHEIYVLDAVEEFRDRKKMAVCCVNARGMGVTPIANSYSIWNALRFEDVRIALQEILKLWYHAGYDYENVFCVGFSMGGILLSQVLSHCGENLFDRVSLCPAETAAKTTTASAPSNSTSVPTTALEEQVMDYSFLKLRGAVVVSGQQNTLQNMIRQRGHRMWQPMLVAALKDNFGKWWKLVEERMMTQTGDKSNRTKIKNKKIDPKKKNTTSPPATTNNSSSPFMGVVEQAGSGSTSSLSSPSPTKKTISNYPDHEFQHPVAAGEQTRRGLQSRIPPIRLSDIPHYQNPVPDFRMPDSMTDSTTTSAPADHWLHYPDDAFLHGIGMPNHFHLWENENHMGTATSGEDIKDNSSNISSPRTKLQASSQEHIPELQLDHKRILQANNCADFDTYLAVPFYRFGVGLQGLANYYASQRTELSQLQMCPTLFLHALDDPVCSSWGFLDHVLSALKTSESGSGTSSSCGVSYRMNQAREASHKGILLMTATGGHVGLSTANMSRWFLEKCDAMTISRMLIKRVQMQAAKQGNFLSGYLLICIYRSASSPHYAFV